MAHHLTSEERGFLDRLLKAGRPKAEIAALPGRDRSTISRELNRNTGGQGYHPQQAQCLAETRRQRRRKPSKLDESVIRRYVEERLKRRWSPGQIAGRSRRDFPREPRRQLSRRTVYTWVHAVAPH
jgi:IS30 family transposase